jgi:hypothetical protein
MFYDRSFYYLLFVYVTVRFICIVVSFLYTTSCVHSLFIFFNVVPSRMTYWTGVIWPLPRLFPLHLPYRLQSSRTVPSQSSRMPSTAQRVSSVQDSSSLSMTRGGGRRCRSGRRQVVYSLTASLPSWIVGNSIAMPWVRFVIVYVSQQLLGHLACAVPPGDAVPSWAYVSHQLCCSQLISHLLLDVAE